MTNFTISLPQLQMFFLVFLRVIAILMTVPVFSSKNIPLLFRVGLGFSITVLLIPLLKTTGSSHQRTGFYRGPTEKPHRYADIPGH
jgi:flagellar biosynthesis protein FliR